MNGTTLTAIQTELVKEYQARGFESASALLIIIIASLFIGIFSIIVYKMIKNTEITRKETTNNLSEERKQNRELLEKMMGIFEASSNNQTRAVIDMNEKLVAQMKEISEKQTKTIESFNSSIEGMYNIIDLHSSRTIETINSDKMLSLDEFEKMTKTIMENTILFIRGDLESRVQKNDLFKLKQEICGSEVCCYENSEVYSIIRNRTMIGRNKIRELKFNNEALKEKLFQRTDGLIKEVTRELCLTFDVVDENYIKASLFRAVTNISYKMINKINEIDFKAL